MNFFDRIISAVSPQAGLARAQARIKLRSVNAAYEAAKPSRLRKTRGDLYSGNAVAAQASHSLWRLARDLDQNYDLAKGALDVLVHCTVGRGIQVEPMIKNVDGSLATDVNAKVKDLWRNWCKLPEVTKELSWAQCERLAARSFFRDGEVFGQSVEGSVSYYSHDTIVPLSIELLECDMVPVEYSNIEANVIYGIGRDSWGKATIYYVHKTHPGETFRTVSLSDVKPISSDRMFHAKIVSRIRQSRGVSVFAPVFTRLDDLRDYEESERVAARIASAQVIAITKPSESEYSMNDATGNGSDARAFSISPGSIWDNLLPGEKPEIISSDRPSNLLGEFRSTQIRSASAGIGCNYSSMAKDYGGNYSSQRQELVESYRNYDVLRDTFVDSWSRPVYERFVKLALISLKLPKNIAQTTVLDADFRGQPMAWIDPEREINAEREALSIGLKSRSQALRERGLNPDEVDGEIAKDIARETSLFDGEQVSLPDSKQRAPQAAPQAQAAQDSAPPTPADTKKAKGK